MEISKFFLSLVFVIFFEDAPVSSSPGRERRDFNPNVLMDQYMNIRTNIDSYGSYHPSDVASTVQNTFDSKPLGTMESTPGGQTITDGSGEGFNPNKWGFSLYNPNDDMDNYLGRIVTTGLSGPIKSKGIEHNTIDGKTSHQTKPLGMNFDPNSLNAHLMSTYENTQKHKQSPSYTDFIHGMDTSFNPGELNGDLINSIAYNPMSLNSKLIPKEIFPSKSVSQIQANEISESGIHSMFANSESEHQESVGGIETGSTENRTLGFHASAFETPQKEFNGDIHNSNLLIPIFHTIGKNNGLMHVNGYSNSHPQGGGVDTNGQGLNGHSSTQQSGSFNGESLEMGGLGHAHGVSTGYVQYHSQIGPDRPESEIPPGTGNFTESSAHATGIGSLGPGTETGDHSGTQSSTSGAHAKEFSGLGGGSFTQHGISNGETTLNTVSGHVTGIGGLGDTSLTQQSITHGQQIAQTNIYTVNMEPSGATHYIGNVNSSILDIHATGIGSLGNIAVSQSGVSDGEATIAQQANQNNAAETEGYSEGVHATGIGSLGGRVHGDKGTGSQEGVTGLLGSSVNLNGIRGLVSSKVSQFGDLGSIATSEHTAGISDQGNGNPFGGTGSFGPSVTVKVIGELGNTDISKVGIPGRLGSSVHVTGIGSLGNNEVAQTSGYGGDAVAQVQQGNFNMHATEIGSLGGAEFQQTSGVSNSKVVADKIGGLGNDKKSASEYGMGSVMKSKESFSDLRLPGLGSDTVSFEPNLGNFDLSTILKQGYHRVDADE